MLVGSNVSDEGLAELKSLKTLKYLNLSETPVTDEGLKTVKDLTNL
jgi:hypothetical protein